MLPSNQYSFQLFSSRAGDLDAQFALLGTLGYTDVQPFFFAPPENHDAIDAQIALMQHYGMTAESGHFKLSMFDDGPDLVAGIAKKYGMWLVVVPWIEPEDRPTTREGWQAIGARLEQISDEMAARGLTFAYHNHEFEMEPLPDGSFPITHLLGEKVAFEPDLAWIAVAGQDPAEWLDKYAGRIPAVHVKDIAPAGECLDEKGFADLGHGVMDWDRLWPLSCAAGSRLMVVEHDLPNDWRRFATRAMASLQRLAQTEIAK
ncbi:sugar phosphate isomerase/epimerase family protein [Ketogulonicigenium vulgare]|uniref:AP endonuclease, family 2 n=1 Tax=Ketogulonicigenium vulgare (strain WSH-001) TaxID=759362 RepID=F9Y8R0_KETVW|nr:sugar phosphate isomerase/epimerase [Ketogulonicigenium vulgare]ADO43051.1 AP endonuclease, family 2 [Ketogulonicigenium vulgare Y25]AEM41229.1 AP endonuclease, family 2 [Ketogulonicigenium vulgare WSH-001]ALJ81371.1 AP endonuclease [Ketogulonicigenium vulgare]ANW34102.1 AP endonuclease [Ketogulonicigenium vulgare]AOZ54962.1 AP endonuclease, family 2 [Ketogulonicigenium vulgare]